MPLSILVPGTGTMSIRIWATAPCDLTRFGYFFPGWTNSGLMNSGSLQS